MYIYMPICAYVCNRGSGDIECIVCLKVKPSNYSTKQKAFIFMASDWRHSV